METKQKTSEYFAIEKAIEGTLQEGNYSLVDIIVSGKQTLSITIYVYGSSRMDIDSLGILSRNIQESLENLDFLQEGFFLEVSSPGIFRKIKYADEFAVFITKSIKIITQEGEVLTGVLEEYTPGESITLSCDDTKNILPIAEIKRASLNG